MKANKIKVRVMGYGEWLYYNRLKPVGCPCCGARGCSRCHMTGIIENGRREYWQAVKRDREALGALGNAMAKLPDPLQRALVRPQQLSLNLFADLEAA